MPKTLTSRPRSLDSQLRPVKRAVISDDIVEQLVALISMGQLQPGQRLPSERELCKKFGAGRSSLREALRCLSIMGVLNARVGKGTSVAADGARFLGKVVEWRLTIEQHDIENLFEVRIALECLAVESIARLRSAAAIAKLEKILKEMTGSLQDAKRYGAFDLEFHVTLGKASENALLFDLISMIRGQLVRALAKVLGVPRALSLTLKEHRAIVQAIKLGDPDRARRAMQAHLHATLDRFRKSLSEAPVREVDGMGSRVREQRTRRSARGAAINGVPSRPAHVRRGS
jgi:GntR family transcriptional regulator, transcriptional repressor for pyruvate dehydrogenase complex